MPELPRLDRDVADVGVVARARRSRRASSARIVVSCAREVLVAAGVRLLGRDRAAHLLERLVEVVRQAPSSTPAPGRRGSRPSAPSGSRARTSPRPSPGTDRGSRRGRSCRRSAVTCGFVDDGEIIGTPYCCATRPPAMRQRRGDLAEHRHDLVARDEPRDRGAGLLGLALVVVGLELDLLPRRPRPRR